MTSAPERDHEFAVRQREREHPQLFPGADLVLPESVINFKKSVSAIHAIPVKAEHAQSLNNRRLLDALILVAQLDCKSRGADFIRRIREERVSPLFEVRITDLARLAGIPGKNYQRIYAELDAIYDMTMQWNAIGDDNQVAWRMKSHVLSLLGHGKGEKRGLVRFAFDPAVLEIVLEPNRWARLVLDILHQLKTSASYALYQNTWRYIGTQNKATPALPTETWIELLVGKSKYVTEDSKGNLKVKNYAEFKRRVLVDAINRINAVPALTHWLELKELKSGNRVVRLQFKFLPKEEPAHEPPQPAVADNARLLKAFGYTQTEIEQLTRTYRPEQVVEAAVRFKQSERRLQQQGKGIACKKAYFSGILQNLATEPTTSETASPPGPPTDEAQHTKLKEAFLAAQRTRFTAWLFGLPPAEREALVAAFLADPAVPQPTRQFLVRGVSPSNPVALAVLREWLAATRPDLLAQALPNPEDQSFDAWLARRTEQT